jgi:hypothetical protein
MHTSSTTPVICGHGITTVVVREFQAGSMLGQFRDRRGLQALKDRQALLVGKDHKGLPP